MRKFLVTMLALATICVSLAILVPPNPASAVPSFSRLHGLPCNECHSAFPRLNPFGMDYKQRGYRLPGEEGLFIWDQKTLPISALAVGRLRISHQDNPVTGARTRTRSRFELEEVELMVAGTAAPKVGYLLEFAQEVADGEEFGTEQAWVQFSDLLPASLLNLRAGMMLNEFYFISQKRRLTFQRYLSPITFNVTGVELNGTWRRLRFAGGVVNDERSSSTSTPPNTPAVNLETRLQGYYVWGTYTIADQTLGIRYINTKSNSDNPSPVIDGRNRQQLDATVNLWFAPVEVILGYFHNFDIGGVNRQQRRSFLAEGIVEVIPEKLFLDTRFELQDTAFVTGSPNNPTTANGTQVTANLTYYLLPNIRLIAEFDKVSGEGLGVFAFAGPNSSATNSEERYMVGFQIGL
ncbi:hypothetical protein [Candidatus Nitronereus thalassa]|uniref:Uncharacterized protein n=1 Tax=Candidatus Nitronereus thalassa TaxID=3020898 RepID=A0ABU3K2Z2_9BACT|nr:hypothetical protein [Candidatus Nitronereus thalassa]MDT7040758.1 hypothetical protein [Candidatus Nitronereus thalassa]